MTAYLTRRGRRPSKARHTPLTDYTAILALWTHEAPDDGRDADCGAEPQLVKTCPDCKRGPVVWAEAGGAPGRQVCPYCGSQWHLDRRRDAKGEAIGEKWCLRRARFYPGGAR
jgi:hypothetical protein